MLHQAASQFDVPSRHRPGRVKLLVGLLTFCCVFGGWEGLSRYRDLHSPLPGSQTPAGACTIWFVGSSTIQRWSSLESDIRPWRAVNRGIFAAQIGYIHRRMLNEPGGRQPGAIVFYAGDNDIAAGRTAAEAYAETASLLEDARKRFGPEPIFLLSLKPSPTRWANFPAQSAYNTGLRGYAARHAGVHFVDVVPSLLRAGRPGPYYAPDGIHLNRVGYGIVRERLREQLRATIPANIEHGCGPFK